MKNHKFWVGEPDYRIAVKRWGEADKNKQVIMLVHGTGFVAESWEDVAKTLSENYTVYAIDRRGHGESFKPALSHYHFADFAHDLYRVIEDLGLSNVIGVGHSAGATDILLCTKFASDRFDRILAIEPTIMNPGEYRPGVKLSDWGESSIQRALKRRLHFENFDTALELLQAAPGLANWQENAIRTYLTYGFETLDDGRLRLLCTPEIEAAMARPIFEAMEQIYVGDHRGNPFQWLFDIKCPVRIYTAQQSFPIYSDMASRAMSMIPGATHEILNDVGHCVPQESPDIVIEALT